MADLDEAAFVDVLRRATSALTDAAVPYVLMGGIGSATHGRPRWTHDIDVFVKPERANSALSALADAGFQTEKTHPDWWHESSACCCTRARRT